MRRPDKSLHFANCKCNTKLKVKSAFIIETIFYIKRYPANMTHPDIKVHSQIFYKTYNYIICRQSIFKVLENTPRKLNLKLNRALWFVLRYILLACFAEEYFQRRIQSSFSIIFYLITKHFINLNYM